MFFADMTTFIKVLIPNFSFLALKSFPNRKRNLYALYLLSYFDLMRLSSPLGDQVYEMFEDHQREFTKRLVKEFISF